MLWQNLQKNVKDFVHLKEHFTDENQLENMDRFQETSLPPQAEFYNKLNDKSLSDAEYSHVQEVWNAFNCKTMKDYQDVYLISDMLLLADIFREFRDECYSSYKVRSCSLL